MSHTPGPWKHVAEIFVDDSEGRTLCVPQSDREHRVDDARLIAESPSMLEALQRIADIPNKLEGGDWDEIEEARAIAHAAIAKATRQAH